MKKLLSFIIFMLFLCGVGYIITKINTVEKDETIHMIDEKYHYEKDDLVLEATFDKNTYMFDLTAVNLEKKYSCDVSFYVYSDMNATKLIGRSDYSTYDFDKINDTKGFGISDRKSNPLTYKMSINCNKKEEEGELTKNDIGIIVFSTIILSMFGIVGYLIRRESKKPLLNSALFRQRMTEHFYNVKDVTSDYSDASLVLEGSNEKNIRFIFFDMKSSDLIDKKINEMKLMVAGGNEKLVTPTNPHNGVLFYRDSMKVNDKYLYCQVTNNTNYVFFVICDIKDIKEAKKIIRKL